MVIMDAPTSMSYKIKELLLCAWRERWTEIDFGRNIRQLLPRGVSGDVYDLSDCILRQAISGPMPNSLLMSYLNHCLGAEIISFGAAILAITKIQDTKPSCIFCLLDFINKYKFKISCHGNEDESLALCKALASLIHWLYQIISLTITGPVTTVQPEDTNMQIIQLISNILSYISKDPFLQALLYVGKLEEPSLWANWCKLYKEANAKLALISDKSYEDTIKVITSFQNNIEWLSQAIKPDLHSYSSSPIINVTIKQIINSPTHISYRPIAYRCIQAVISFAAVLDHLSSADVTANQIALISRFYDISLPQVFCEALHVCLVCLLDADKLNTEDPKYVVYFHTWIAFFLFKIPPIFQSLTRLRPSESKSTNDLKIALNLLLERGPLLELFDTSLKTDYIPKLLEEFEKRSLLTKDAIEKFNESRKAVKASFGNCNTSEDSGQMFFFARAEQTITAVINSFHSENHEAILALMCRMHKSLGVILSTSASTGSMPTFAQKLVLMNDAYKVSNGENLRTSQQRAVIFDISFLSLCTLVQQYGTEVLTNISEIKDIFFVKWSNLNFAQRLSPENILNSFSDSKIDSLLGQFIVVNSSVEFKTSLVRWHDMCVAAQLAVSHVLSAWHNDVLSMDAVKVCLERLKKLCCLTLSAVCWLIAQLNVASQEQSVKIMYMLNELRNPLNVDNNGDSQDSAPDPLMLYYKERASLLDSCLQSLFDKYLPQTTALPKSTSSPAQSPAKKHKGLSSNSSLRLSRNSLNVQLKDALDSYQGNLGMKSIYQFDCLMILGGARWFTNNVVSALFHQSDHTKLHQAVDLAYGLFHLDLEQCALVLLSETLPRLLLVKSEQDNLSEPRVTSLVRLTIMTTFGALTQLESFKASGFPRRGGHRRNYQEILQSWQFGEIDQDMLECTAYSYEAHTTNGSNCNSLRNTNGRGGACDEMEVDLIGDKCADSPNGITDDLLSEPLYIELIKFFNLLLDESVDNEFTPRSYMSVVVMEEIVMCLAEDSCQFFQFVPFTLLEGIIRCTHDILTFEQLLSYLPLNNGRARKTGTRLLVHLQQFKEHKV